MDAATLERIDEAVSGAITANIINDAITQSDEVIRFKMKRESILTEPARRRLAEAMELVIDSPEMAQIAADNRAAVNRGAKDTEEERLEICRGIDAGKAPVNDRYKPVVALLAEARKVLDEKILAWQASERRRIAAEQAKLDEEERQRKAAADATAARIAAEAAAEAERLRAKAAEAIAAGDVGVAARLEVEAENKVAHAEARVEQVVVAATTPRAVTVAAPARKAEGMHTATTYAARCNNLAELVKFVAANPMFLNLVQANGPALNSQAVASKDAFAIPGCELVKTTGVRSR